MVDITGGHILTSVYGGNEMTNVDGTATITMTGGTVGVPRTLGQIAAHPVTGNIFGAGMGDTRSFFNEFTNVANTEINISGSSHVYGSVFGGGDAGKVKNDTKINISGTIDSTKIDQDVFGGGNEANVYGNTTVNISGGHILHNVYGGGKMGSVGTITEIVNHDDAPAADGALYKFSLSWPVKLVYKSGTGETHVNVTGGRIGTSGDDNGDVFGGGMGSLGIDWVAKGIDLDGSSDDTSLHDIVSNNADDVAQVIRIIDAYRYEEQMIANVNNTHVNINIENTPTTLDNVAKAIQIWDTDDQELKAKFIIDATYQIPQKPKLDEHGVQIVIDDVPQYEDDPINGSFTNFGNTPCITGSVYGGSENGHVIGNTELILTNGIVGHALYGGGKGKGTYQGRLLNLKNATEHQYKPDYSLNDQFQPILNSYVEPLYSLTAGKVYGNTNILMENGFVIRSVFGGGNLGSVGKGNYSGGTDDYSLIGYGELPGVNQPLCEGESGSFAYEFMHSGKTTVDIRGGQIGYILPSTAGTVTDREKVARKDDLPTGNVFGACRGQVSPNGNVSPRYLYIPDFFLGYVNETEVKIGDGTGNGPRILGSVYGGGQDGHVRRGTTVTINNAEIGIEYNEANKTLLGKDKQDNLQWRGRGNVFGAGSGIGTYEIRNNDGKYVDTNGNAIADNDTDTKHAKDYNYSSGSVTGVTKVEINDKVEGKTIIHQNVYGGGSLASIGPPQTGQGFFEFNDTTKKYPDLKDVENNSMRAYLTHKSSTSTNVIINGGTIGDENSYAAGYGGNVFGASRGNLDNLNLGDSNNASKFATSIWTKVEAKDGMIYGNVFGGGESGAVMKDTHVIIGGKEVSSGSSTGGSSTGGGSTGGIQGRDAESPQVAPAQGNAAVEAPQGRSVITNRVNQ